MFHEGDQVTVKATGERTKIKSMSWEGGPYIWLENGDRVGDMDQLEKTEVKYPAIYRHYKHTEDGPLNNYMYAVIGISIPAFIDFGEDGKENDYFECKHTEEDIYIPVYTMKNKLYHQATKENEKIVVYKSLYDDGIYARPLDMFLEEAPGKENPSGQEYRFELVKY